MKKAPKSPILDLHRETLRILETRDLDRVAGALPPTQCCGDTLECSPSCIRCG